MEIKGNTFKDVKVLVFDFDGVIVAHSEFFKEEAWKEVFAPYSGKYETFFKEASSQFGFGKKGDRFDILRYVLERLETPDIETTISKGAEQFNTYVQERILKEGVVLGVKEALGKLMRDYPLYLNSGTAQEGLDESVKALGLTQYFNKVLGGPASKGENMIKIFSFEKTEPLKNLLIGDSNGDLMAAEETGCQFIGVANEWNKWEEKDCRFPLINHIKDVLDFL